MRWICLGCNFRLEYRNTRVGDDRLGGFCANHLVMTGFG